MAFDTRDKRASAMSGFLLALMPDPDGLAFSQADRQQVQGVYSGILAAAPPAITSRALLIGKPPGAFATKQCIAENFIYI